MINNISKSILSFMFLMLIVTVSATTLSTYIPQKVNVEFNFTQICNDATYMTLSTIVTPNSTEIININMTSTGGGSFYYNYTSTQIGRYDFTGISDGCLKTFAVYVDVTPNGKTYDTGDSLIYIFISIFFIVMMLGFYRFSKSLNYEKWYEDIKQKYITKNAVKWSLAAIGYVIMRESAIVYFLLGLPIMIILMDLVFVYNITSISLYMQSLLYLYIASIMVLAVVLLSFAQEWFMGLIEDVQNINWGTDE